jgi:hypothetical protein
MASRAVNNIRTNSGAVLAVIILLMCTTLPLTPVSAQDLLPSDVRFDILKLELFEAARKDRHKEILVITAKMRKIGQEMPEETPYFEARAFHSLGATAMARRSLVGYFKIVGRKGRNYDSALRLFVEIKAAQDERARKAKTATNLRADFEASQAAWQAAEARAVQWKKHAVVFGGPGDDSATAIAHTPEGGIIMAGAFHLRKTRDGKPLNTTLPWVTAFDVNGRRTWHRPLGTATDPGLLRSVTMIPRLGFLFGGAQKDFQVAALSDPLGNLATTSEGDPWVIGFAPALAGEGGIARLLTSGDIMVLGAEAIGQNKTTGQAQARLPVAVRLAPTGKLLSKSVLGQSSGMLWYDVKDAIVLKGGDVILAGETRRRADSPLAATEGYLMRLSPMGKEIWLKRFAASRGDGLAVTALAASADGGILATGRDGNSLVYFKLSGTGEVLWRKHRKESPTPKIHTRLCATKDLSAQLAAAYDRTRRGKAQPIAPDKIDSVRHFACRNGEPFTAATAIVARPSGGFMILGLAGRKEDSRTRITLTAIRGDGSVNWETSHGDTLGLLPTGILPTADGGFVVVGVASNWGRDALLFKANKRGELVPFTVLNPFAPPRSTKPPRKPTPKHKPITQQEAPPSAATAPPETKPKTAATKEEKKAVKAPTKPAASLPRNEKKSDPEVKIEATSSRDERDKVSKTTKAQKSAKPSPTTPSSPAASDGAEYDLIKLLDGLFGGSANIPPESD